MDQVRGRQPAPRPPRDHTIRRNIWFYRIFDRKEEGAIAEIDPRALCEEIAALENAYYATEPGKGVVCELFGEHADRLLMLKILWSDHPGTWEDGARGESGLPENRALYNATHVRFFPNNVVGIDVNRSGPWPTALRDYIRDRLQDAHPNFQMVQIPDRTALERLARITSVSSMQLQLSKATLARIPQPEHNYMQAIDDIASIGNADIVNISWKRWGRERALNAEALKAIVQYLIENSQNLDEKATITLKGSDRGGRPESFNLTRDFVAAQVEVARLGNRRIDDADAFRKIEAAFETVRRKIPEQAFLLHAE